jgi:hypothetical protein
MLLMSASKPRTSQAFASGAVGSWIFRSIQFIPHDKVARVNANKYKYVTPFATMLKLNPACYDKQRTTALHLQASAAKVHHAFVPVPYSKRDGQAPAHVVTERTTTQA